MKSILISLLLLISTVSRAEDILRCASEISSQRTGKVVRRINLLVMHSRFGYEYVMTDSILSFAGQTPIYEKDGFLKRMSEESFNFREDETGVFIGKLFGPGRYFNDPTGVRYQHEFADSECQFTIKLRYNAWIGPDFERLQPKADEQCGYGTKAQIIGEPETDAFMMKGVFRCVPEAS